MRGFLQEGQDAVLVGRHSSTLPLRKQGKDGRDQDEFLGH